MQRRSFLKSLGAISVIAVGGRAWRVYDTGVLSVGKGPAFEPWENWQHSKDNPLALVRAAILAASPHNTQPWLFQVTDSFIDLYLDSQRYPGAVDPYLREEHIGMGCALENLMLAAAPNGYAASATLFPGKLVEASAYARYKRVAHVELFPGKKHRSELHNAIPHRHTNRNPYQPTSLPANFVDEIRQIASNESDVKMFVFTAGDDRRRIVDMMSKACDIVFTDPQMVQGSDRFVRQEWSDVQKLRDGLILDEWGQAPLTTAMRKVAPPSWWRSTLRHKIWPTTSYMESVRATPFYGLIVVRDRYDLQQSLRAGRIWQRAHLLATARNVAGQPLNQIVELVDHQRSLNQQPQAITELTELIGDPDWQPTFMFRLGYPIRDVGPSPRRPLQACLLTKLALLLLLLCSLSLAHGQACPTRQRKGPATLAQIEQVWLRAVEQHDKVSLGCILADEFEEASFDGSLIDRSAMLATATNPGTAHFELSDLHAHVHGNSAYVRGVGGTRSEDGTFHAKNRFTDIFVYRNGRWQCVAGHESHFPER
jgi:Domain of unknown function (DUF4440)